MNEHTTSQATRLPGPNENRREKGFTLMELMVAGAILTYGILGYISSVQAIGSKMAGVPWARTLAATLAQEQMARFAHYTWTGSASDAGLVTRGGAPSINGGTGLCDAPSVTDDAAKGAIHSVRYSGLTFYRTWSAETVDHVGASVPGGATAFKRMTVYVFWNGFFPVFGEGTPLGCSTIKVSEYFQCNTGDYGVLQSGCPL